MEGIGIYLQSIYQEHILLMSHPMEKYSSGELAYTPPFIKPSLLINILDIATNILVEEPIVLNINVPVYIIGDLHGNILDLYRIFQSNGLPPQSNYLFLGDFVDRGVYSTELICLIAIMKVLFPKNIFILRGNHEFMPTKPNSDFTFEIQKLYQNNQDLLTRFYYFFSFMPLAARVGDYLCLHGGLDPNLKTIEQIEALKRPITFETEIVEGIVWSDPKMDNEIEFVASPRGNGYLFNNVALNNFLKENNLRGLIRGHSFVDGVEMQYDGKLITVFSASNYSDSQNSSGVILFNSNIEIYPIRYPALLHPPRNKLTKASFESRSTRVFNKNTSVIPKVTKNQRLSKVYSQISKPRANSMLPTLKNHSNPQFVV